MAETTEEQPLLFKFGTSLGLAGAQNCGGEGSHQSFLPSFPRDLFPSCSQDPAPGEVIVKSMSSFFQRGWAGSTTKRFWETWDLGVGRKAYLLSLSATACGGSALVLPQH